MKKQNGFTLVEMLAVTFIVVGTWGWIWNIVKIVDSNFDHITGILVARCIGVFVAPLGAVLGFV